MAIVAIGASVVAGAVQYSQQKKAAKAQARAAEEARKSQKLQQKQSDIRSARERRKQIAQAQVIASENQAGGFSSGVIGSSAALGGAAQAQSTAAGNVAFSNTLQGISGQITEHNIQGSIFESQAAKYKARAGFAGQVGSIFQGTSFS